MKTNRQPAKLEQRLQYCAHYRANKQLMLVPWSRFHEALEHYVHLECVVLWVRTLTTGNPTPGPLVESTIRIHFPGFLDREARSEPSPLLGYDLNDWLHRQMFASARQEGWFDALVFYGFRDPRAQSAWAFWQHCEKQRRRRVLSNRPSLQRWLRLGQEYNPQGASLAYLLDNVERYVDWSAFSFWIKPWLTHEGAPPKRVREELRRRCPQFPATSQPDLSADGSPVARKANRLMAWVERNVFQEAKEKGWLQAIRCQTHLHPRYARMEQYSRIWSKGWSAKPGLQYPSLLEWRQAAEDYTRE